MNNNSNNLFDFTSMENKPNNNNSSNTTNFNFF